MASEQSDSRIAYLEGKLREKPDSYFFLPLAYCYLESGRLEEAEETCAEGLKTHPHYTGAKALLGYIHHLRKDDHRAEEELISVVEDDPHNPLVRRLLGEICAGRGDAPRAIGEYRKALALCPGDEEAAEALKELAAAPSDHSMTAAEGPAEEERGERFYASALADIYLREGALNEALNILSRLLGEEPEDHRLRERVRELETRLTGDGPEDREGGAPDISTGPQEVPAFMEHLHQLEADLERMGQPQRPLSADEVRRAVETCTEWLGEIGRSEARAEREERHGQDTGA